MLLKLSNLLELLGGALLLGAAAAWDIRALAAIIGVACLVAGYLIDAPAEVDA